MSVLETVKGCPLFYELYDAEILKIVERCKVLSLQPGDVIFSEGDVGHELYMILNGRALVKKNGQEIAKLRKGDLFGEMVLLKEHDRKATTVSSNFTDVLVVDYDQIFGTFESNTKIFALLMLNLSRMLATRLAKAGAVIAEMKQGERAA